MSIGNDTIYTKLSCFGPHIVGLIRKQLLACTVDRPLVSTEARRSKI